MGDMPETPTAESSCKVQWRPHAICWVTPELVVRLAAGQPFRVLRNPMPADAKVVSVTYSPEREAFGVTVRSESFAPVAEGSIVPTIEGPTYERCAAWGPPEENA